jgi:hypothetical protein
VIRVLKSRQALLYALLSRCICMVVGRLQLFPVSLLDVSNFYSFVFIIPYNFYTQNDVNIDTENLFSVRMTNWYYFWLLVIERTQIEGNHSPIYQPLLLPTSIYLQFIMPDAFHPHGAILSGSVRFNFTC